MKNIWMSILVIGVTAGLLGTGTYAYFSDPETAKNTFSAGSLDLQLSDDGITYVNDPIDPLIECKNMAPGDESVEKTLYFKNAGTMDGIVIVGISYVEHDDPLDDDPSYEYAVAYNGPGSNDMSADDFAKHLWVTEATLDGGPNNIVYYWALQVVDDAYGHDWAAAIAAEAVYDPDGGVNVPDGNELPTAFGLAQITLHFWDTYQGADVPFTPGDVHYETLKAQLDPNVGNDYQFDGIYLIIEPTITQVH
jgi:predicted ribosomally synthesized peptide with SipW-like signal peptide